MSKTKSIFKKVKSVLDNGLEPIEIGMANYEKNDPKIESKALDRYEKARHCKNLVIEPIDMFKVKDERIKGLSNKMCDNCGCAAAYLFRQDKKKCKCWK